MRKALLPIAILLLFVVEILRIYFIMPFPGSQYDNTIQFAFFMDRTAIWFRVVLWLFVVWQVYRLIANKKWWRFAFSLFFIGLYALIAYFLNFRLNADKMFYQPQHKIFAQAQNNQVAPGKLIIGIVINGEAAAYPIEVIGYHHQVRDTVGGKEIMVTYCTVCRTGRIFDPVVNGKSESFRLVGMDHFNAMFEDGTTHSWWRQATGEAVAGKRKGESLKELVSEQMTLKTWLAIHPASKILQADTAFLKEYKDLVGFDDGSINSDLEKRNPLPWQNKSFVVTVEAGVEKKIFDWVELQQNKCLEGAVASVPIVLMLGTDNEDFHAFDARLDAQTLHFIYDTNAQLFTDDLTHSQWNEFGKCLSGALIGAQLTALTAHQEFYHAAEEF